MSIFRRESEPSPEPPAPARETRPAPRAPAKQKSTPSGSTHIATGSKVVGEISGEADLVIDGVIEGEIHLESRVVVSNDGRVEGKIHARSVEVAGKVLGNVRGGERVKVLATGSLEGDVLSPRVEIAEGAFFKGRVEMTDKISGAPAKATSPKPETKAPAGGAKPIPHQHGKAASVGAKAGGAR